MDILHDIEEVERCLLHEFAEGEQYLHILRVFSLAKRYREGQDARRCLSVARCNSAQLQAWTEAFSAWQKRLQGESDKWLHARDQSLDDNVSATLRHILPLLYQKFLGSTCEDDQKNDCKRDDEINDLQRQLDDMRLELATAKDGTSGDEESISDHVMFKLEASEKENKRLSSTNKALQQQLSEHQTLQGEAERMATQFQEMRSNAAINEARILETEAECIALCNEVDGLRARNELLVTQNQDLAQDMRNLQWQHEALLENIAVQKRSGTLPIPADLSLADDLADQSNLSSDMCTQARTPQSDNHSADAATSANLDALLEASPPGRHRHEELLTAAVENAIPPSPGKRAADSASPSDSVRASPLKKQAHAFGIGDHIVTLQSSQPISVPRALWDTARSDPRASARPADASTCPQAGLTAAIADLPLNQQPHSSQSGGLQTYSVSPASRQCAEAHPAITSAPPAGATNSQLLQGFSTRHHTEVDMRDAVVQCTLIADMVEPHPPNAAPASPAVSALQSPASKLASRALEASIMSITATNDLLRSFRAQFLSQLQAMASQERGAHTAAHAVRMHTGPSSRAEHVNVMAQARAGAGNGSEGDGRVASWMESTLQQWQQLASPVGCTGGSQPEFEFALLGAGAAGATPGLGVPDPMLPPLLVPSGHPVARQLFADPDMHQHPLRAAVSTSAAMAPVSVFESVIIEAEKQKGLARAALASSVSTCSGTPAWAAGLSENSNPNSPTQLTSHPTTSAAPLPGAPSAVQGQLLSLQHSLVSATHEQQNLVDALQAEFALLSDRVAAAGLELDMLHAELDLLREQVNLCSPPPLRIACIVLALCFYSGALFRHAASTPPN
jgi:hypothetical protein